jgi:hypothetical protein
MTLSFPEKAFQPLWRGPFCLCEAHTEAEDFLLFKRLWKQMRITLRITVIAVINLQFDIAIVVCKPIA